MRRTKIGKASHLEEGEKEWKKIFTKFKVTS
jgi:hypothetical protein